MKKVFLSPSTINLHESCPRCFYLHMKYEIKRPRGPMPSIAIGMDSVMKRYFEYYRAIGELPPVLRNDMEGKLIKYLRPTYFHDIRAGYCLLGKLDDCLVCKDQTHSPLDHKTRANPPDYIHPTYTLQMELYSILLEGNKLPANDMAYLIYYCPKKMEPESSEQNIEFTVDIKKVEIDTKHAMDAVERAIACLEKNTIPDLSPDCEYCQWLSDALEPAGRKESTLPDKYIRHEEKDSDSAEKKEKEADTEYRDSLF